jgi:hypothetical protein
MGPTSFTVVERDALNGLLGLYERERAMYAEVLELTRSQVSAVRAGRDLEDIRGIFERKRRMLDMISSMETGFDEAKAVWRRLRYAPEDDLTRRIKDCLKQLGETIEEVLNLEEETDRLFMAAAEAV